MVVYWIKLMNMVSYFEDGCLCVLTGRIAKVGNAADAETAEQYYMDNCTCTRHPESHTRECWDYDKKQRAEALVFIKVKRKK